MRSGSVSMPCRIWNAVNGAMHAPKSRMPSRRARSRNAAVVDSSLNTMSWKPSYGSVSVGNLPRAAARPSRSGPQSTSTPPMTTPWPERNLVAEWKTRSAPCSNGRMRYGVVNVESTSSGKPCVVRDVGHARNVEHVEPGIAERLAEQQPRLGPDRRAPRVDVARIDERRRRCRSAAACSRADCASRRRASATRRCARPRPAASRWRDAAPPGRWRSRSRRRRPRARRCAPRAPRTSDWRCANRRGRRAPC